MQADANRSSTRSKKYKNNDQFIEIMKESKSKKPKKSELTPKSFKLISDTNPNQEISLIKKQSRKMPKVLNSLDTMPYEILPYNTSFNPKNQNNLNTPICFNSSPSQVIVNEKTRLISINEAFEILRSYIPTFPYERRLSKIDTLHLAISYINLLESVIESNMTLYDYLKTSINYSFGTNNYQTSSAAGGYNTFDWSYNKPMAKPVWATSDLTVRLNWLNWNALGVSECQIQSFLNLFKMFGDFNRDKAILSLNDYR